MPHDEIAICPQCGKVAYGRKEIEEKFGYRNGSLPQSWCRECRSKGSKCYYTDCPFWGEDSYPRCSYDTKCPLNDD